MYALLFFWRCRIIIQSPLEGSCVAQGRSRQGATSQGRRGGCRSSLPIWIGCSSSTKGNCTRLARIRRGICYRCQGSHSQGCHGYSAVVAVLWYTQCSGESNEYLCHIPVDKYVLFWHHLSYDVHLISCFPYPLRAPTLWFWSMILRLLQLYKSPSEVDSWPRSRRPNFGSSEHTIHILMYTCETDDLDFTYEMRECAWWNYSLSDPISAFSSDIRWRLRTWCASSIRS